MPNDQSHDTRTTNPANRLAQAVGLSVAYQAVQGTPAGVLFQDSFDDQPDFTTYMHSTEFTKEVANGDILPDGFTHFYGQCEWTPETGHPDKHNSLEILASNTDKTRTGTGKSAVFWRESFFVSSTKDWVSDAQLIKLLDQDYPGMYMEFWITFSPNWWQRGTDNFANWASKMIRMGYWDSTHGGDIYNGRDGGLNPRFIWDYKRDAFGVRNWRTCLRGPVDASGTDFDASLNYTSQTKGHAPGGTDPQLIDHVNGGILADFSGATTHDQVFGPVGTWKKMAFWVKKNSAPGVADGQLKMWMNDERFHNVENAVWNIDDGTGRNPGWNYFAIGGNDNFQPFPNEDRFEDWWAMEDLVVRDSIPEGLE